MCVNVIHSSCHFSVCYVFYGGSYSNSLCREMTSLFLIIQISDWLTFAIAINGQNTRSI